MKLIVVRFAVMAALSACLSVNGEHTDNEKMDVARTCLLRAMAIHARGLRYRESNDGAYPDTWRGFLGQCNQEWSLAEKQAAFDLYLRAMSTNNCTSMTPMDQNLARTAVFQCELLDYTNGTRTQFERHSQDNGDQLYTKGQPSFRACYRFRGNHNDQFQRVYKERASICNWIIC